MRARLVLEDGTVWEGDAFGAPVQAVGEVVFNTGMTGFQEVLTDPSYAGQIVVMTYPLIGNTGMNTSDDESVRPQVAGFVVREPAAEPSHWQEGDPIDETLSKAGLPGLGGIDTRALVRHLRQHGTLRGVLTTSDLPVAEAVEMARTWQGGNLVARVTRPGIERYAPETPVRDPLHVVVVDYGAKQNIVRSLTNLGCQVTVVPAHTRAQEILDLAPDGVLLSNGPGDPRDVVGAPETIRQLFGRVPLFGICLGHQLMGLALGARTTKLPFGHRGVNHPVRDERTGEVTITTQNHGYALVEESLPPELRVTHRNLNDQTVEGLAHTELPLFGVQYHPEACPGPWESEQLFHEFIAMMRAFQTGKEHLHAT